MAPLTLLCSPKTITPWAKTQLKRSNGSRALKWGIVCLSNSTSIGDMIKKLNVSHSWFLRFWPNSQNFEISHFLSLYPKYMSYQNLLYLILKLLNKNFCLSEYTMAQGVSTRRHSKSAWFFASTLFIYIVSTLTGSKKGVFSLSFFIFLQKVQKIEENLLTEQTYHQGGHSFGPTL